MIRKNILIPWFTLWVVNLHVVCKLSWKIFSYNGNVVRYGTAGSGGVVEGSVLSRKVPAAPAVAAQLL